MFDLPKSIKLLILIWLTILSSVGYCRIANGTIVLNCNITTLIQGVNDVKNVTTPISAVNRCPENYKNEDIIKKCENLIDSQLPAGEVLFIPVVNNDTNVIYWNEYCATCNDEKNIEILPSWREDCCVNCSIGFLKSELNNTTSQLQCSATYWPFTLIDFVYPNLASKRAKKINEPLNRCQYISKNGKVCTRPWFLIEGFDFISGKYGEIVLDEGPSKIGIEIEDLHVQRGEINNLIFICGSDGNFYKISYHWFKIFIIIVSVILLSIYLVINFNEEYLKNFFNKIVYCYSIGLIIMYLFSLLMRFTLPQSCLFSTLELLSRCFIYSWTMIFNLEFCRLIYCTYRKRKVSVNAQRKRFLIYCFFGFVLPVLIPVIYFYLLLMYKNPCLPVSGYFVLPCKYFKNSIPEIFWNKVLVKGYVWSFLYLVPGLFLLQACVFIYITKWNSTNVRSTANRNDLVVLIKMAYVAGVYWIFCIIHSKLSESNNLKPIKEFSYFCSHLQGIFVFFAFGFKKTMLNKVWNTCHFCKGVTTETFQCCTEFIVVSVQTQSSRSTQLHKDLSREQNST